mgnify:CR=1 FL=1
MQKLAIHKSVVGEAIYPHLNKPDAKYENPAVYKVTLKVKKSDATAMIDTFNQAKVDSLKQFTKQKGKKVKESPHPNYTTEGDFVFFKFKLKSEGVNRKTKENFIQRPMIFDSQNKPFDLTKQIWGGTKMRIAYQLVPYEAPFGVGITARIKSVQIVDLVQGTPEIPFETTEGYQEETTSHAKPTTVQAGSDF